MSSAVPADQRIYLDNAATSFPRPPAVQEAVHRYSTEIGVAVGRGSSRRAMEVQRVVARCRQRAAELLGVGEPSRVLFTFNGTDSLNLAIHGLLRPGDHVVTSAVEHNSVLRPLKDQEQRHQVQVTLVEADSSGKVDPSSFRRAMRPSTRLVILQHASNVTGVIQPVEEVGQIARSGGALFLVDAAQTAGHLPLNMAALPVDLVACPGHKGLLGPLGTGLLCLRAGIEERLQPVRQGGTGSHSEDIQQPRSLPDRYESGNHNAPGLFGLEASLEWLSGQGVKQIAAREQELTARLIDGLSSLRNIRIAGPADAEQQVAVVSISAIGFEPQELASILDESFEIETRAGLHCAPGAHRAAGTFDKGGTVRLSCGPFTTEQQIEAVVAALADITD